MDKEEASYEEKFSEIVHGVSFVCVPDGVGAGGEGFCGDTDTDKSGDEFDHCELDGTN
jgi:hypothetical protein